MKNNKQLLADFYLALLSIPVDDKFRATNQCLYVNVRNCLAAELGENLEVVQRAFEKMAAEDMRTYSEFKI